MQVNTVHWEKRRAEDPLSNMRRHELQKLCKAQGIKFEPGVTPARDLRILLRKAGYGNENAS